MSCRQVVPVLRYTIDLDLDTEGTNRTGVYHGRNVGIVGVCTVLRTTIIQHVYRLPGRCVHVVKYITFSLHFKSK